MAERERSFWGWGYVDEQPSDERVMALADRLASTFGFPEREPADPPRIESIDIPRPSVAPPDFEYCSGSRASRIRHTYGDAYRDKVRAFYGDFAVAPDVVAAPRSEAEIRSLLEWAAREEVAVIPYGGGTSVVGGVEGDVSDRYAGVLSIDLRNLDAVLDVDEDSRVASIEAGILGPDIQEQLSDYEFQLRHYPQSYEFSTLGGWLATHSGGHFATRYTHIDDFCESVRMLAPSGTLETRPVPKSGAGPDANHLILGSEGTLGIITRARMRVQPRPARRARATVRFDDFDEAVEATREIAQTRLAPANCRLLDENEVRLFDLAEPPTHLLFLGFESLDGSPAADMDAALDICRRYDGVCPRGVFDGEREPDEDAPEARWREAFLDAPYLWDAFVRLGVIFDTFETAVTWEGFPELHETIYEEVMDAIETACGMGHLSCRFTHVYPDGPAPYYTFLAPVARGEELDHWKTIKERAADVLLDQGATITHHHAVGRVHQEWYARESAEFQSAFRAIKSTLDPAGIMNPGVLLRED